jgi:hypothetical protein
LIFNKLPVKHGQHCGRGGGQAHVGRHMHGATQIGGHTHGHGQFVPGVVVGPLPVVVVMVVVVVVVFVVVVVTVVVVVGSGETGVVGFVVHGLHWHGTQGMQHI